MFAAAAFAASGAELRLSVVPSRDSGFVHLVVTGPDGAVVKVEERGAGAPRPVGSVTLTGGRAELPRALRWSCTQRDRTLVGTLPDGTTAQVRVRTPSCAGRLALGTSARGRAGGSVVVRVRDRWESGGLRVSVCATPPGGTPQCVARATQAAGRPWRRTVATPRPGRWTFEVKGTGDARVARKIWVRLPGRKLRLLAAGDSEMQLVDTFIGERLRGRGVRVKSDARPSTGMSNTFFFDWVRHARALARSERPDVTVMFLGANDGFPLPRATGRGRVSCCSQAWSRAYAARVNRAMGSFLRKSRGRVYWFLLPMARGRQAARYFHAVNDGIRMAAAARPGRVRLIDAPAVFTPDGVWRREMTWQGRSTVVRAPDGYHLSTAGSRIAAQLVVRALRADGVVR